MDLGEEQAADVLAGLHPRLLEPLPNRPDQLDLASSSISAE